MHIQNAIKAAIAAFLFGSASQAMANVVTLDSTLAAGYLNQGDYAGTFNGTFVLPKNFVINGLDFSFTFADDKTDSFSELKGTSGKTSSTSVDNLIGGDTKTTYTTTVTNYVLRNGEQESVDLLFGANSYAGMTEASAPVLSTERVFGQPVQGVTKYAKNNGRSCVPSGQDSSCKAHYQYSVTNTVTNTTATDFTGGFTLNGSLLGNSDVLASLLKTRMLGFGLNVKGDLNLVSASVRVDFEEVPEPASVALFGIALLGVAGARRRARRG